MQDNHSPSPLPEDDSSSRQAELVLSTCGSASSLEDVPSVSPCTASASKRRLARLCTDKQPELLVKATAEAAGRLLREEDAKFDFESFEGQTAATAYLDLVEELSVALRVPTCSRAYRAEFTQAYRVLYEPGELGYLAEIIDSAQEQIPHLWVNGEKYMFSNEVIHTGVVLQRRFSDLHALLTTGTPSLAHLRLLLEQLDQQWTHYEQMYVLELIAIEADARRFIRKGIALDQALTQLENGPRRLSEVNLHRKKLVELIGKLNSVANSEGHGRDDLSYQVLLAAEDVARRNRSSACLQRISLDIKQSFADLRILLRKYAVNIEEVDPQLKNNQELVDALVAFENSWEKGKAFILNSTRLTQLLHFSRYVEDLGQKHASFAEQVQCRDAELFLALPALLLLLKLEKLDYGAASYFCPALDDEASALGCEYSLLLRQYRFGKLVSHTSADYFDLLEKAVLGLDPGREHVLPHQYDNLDAALKTLNSLAMQLQRFVPTEWNQFLDAALAE